MQQLTVPLSALRPNPWNPNRMDERHFAAEIDSIRAFGFIDPITVREHPDGDGSYQIVDGEHRYRVLVHLFHGDAVCTQEELDRLPYQDAVPVVSLGTIDDATAKRLTLVLNETRGEAPRADLARVLGEVEALVGAGEALRGLPIDLHELDDLLELARLDLPTLGGVATGMDAAPGGAGDGGEAPAPPRPGGFGRDEGEDDPFLHRILALVSDDDLATLRAARDKVEAEMEVGEDMPADTNEAWGFVVARLAAAYVNSQGAE